MSLYYLFIYNEILTKVYYVITKLNYRKDDRTMHPIYECIAR